MSSKHAALAGHVRRLCSLGAEPHIVIPHVVETVRTLVGADWGMFFYADEHYALSEMYSQNEAIYAIMPLYMSEVHNTETQADAVGVDFTTAMRRGRGYENTARNDAALLKSTMYNELYRPMYIRHSLEMTAFDGKRGWGSMTLKRMPNNRPFSERDLADIRPLSRHIAHALACPKARYLNHTENGRSSVIVIDETGKIVLENGVGVRMLALASGEPVTYVRHARLPDWLTPLVANFNGIWRGGAAAPPTHERCNAAGRFTFKAYRFDHADAMTDHTLIAIYAEHFAPLALEIETRGFQLGLSERQRQLCTYLLFERPHGDIAQLMGIRESTVIDHVRKIYEKLDVHSVAQLKAAFRGIDGGTDRWYM
ncbi:helix-turn-helix transcriptional regulator [Paraburkholderia sp. RL17-337-BIB-A]|uniref:helix-turn-helix transcriptional regulator n=1 Tax=Paraburkholderia sp. RL17-337-BIB-A TaxID=3031636 RepID=UPI0038BD2BCB